MALERKQLMPYPWQTTTDIIFGRDRGGTDRGVFRVEAPSHHNYTYENMEHSMELLKAAPLLLDAALYFLFLTAYLRPLSALNNESECRLRDVVRPLVGGEWFDMQYKAALRRDQRPVMPEAIQFIPPSCIIL